jgi:carbon monoxide dehydrogenase subunit G
MKVTGSAVLHAPRDKVWQALNDPAVLVRTIPGCHQLEAVGQDAYRMTLSAGVASIKGTYQGDVRLSDQQKPESFLMQASGAGGPGTISADVIVRLAEQSDGVTRLDYDADAVVGGMIGGVGQRVLAGVARKTAGEFFQAVDDVLTGKAGAATAEANAATAEADGAAAGAPPQQRPGGLAAAHPEYREPAGVFRRPEVAAPAVPGGAFLQGAVFGAVTALAGALVGGWLAGRRTARR